MTQFSLKGCGTALVTPFKNQEVDYDALEALVDNQIAAGIHFLVPLGTTAETPCLTDDEKVAILNLVKRKSKGLFLLAGAGTNSLEHTKQNIDLLAPCGPDAFLIVTPYYNKPTQVGLKAYFEAVADYSPKPIVLYNVPGRTGVNLTAETTLALAKHPNIIAIKEASGNYAQISRIIGAAPEDFVVLSGNDDETLSLMATGAKGIISVASNIAPRPMVALAEALMSDNMTEARRLHHSLSTLFKNCFVESNPLPVKAGLASMGMIENEFRLPLTVPTQATYDLMKETIAKLNL